MWAGVWTLYLEGKLCIGMRSREIVRVAVCDRCYFSQYVGEDVCATVGDVEADWDSITWLQERMHEDN